MNFKHVLFKEQSTVASLSVVFYAIMIILISCLKYLSVHQNIPLDELYYHPSTVLDANPFVGLISNIGILFWCSAAAICFFCSSIMVKYPSRRDFSFFLLCSALITTMLLLDDWLMFHKTIFPLALHISELLVIAGYVAIIIAFLIQFREQIVLTEFFYLVFAFVFFGLSLITAVLQDILPGMKLFEKIFELFGIVNWFIYFARVCFKSITHHLPARKEQKSS